MSEYVRLSARRTSWTWAVNRETISLHIWTAERDPLSDCLSLRNRKRASIISPFLLIFCQNCGKRATDQPAILFDFSSAVRQSVCSQTSIVPPALCLRLLLTPQLKFFWLVIGLCDARSCWEGFLSQLKWPDSDLRDKNNFWEK